MIRTTIKKLHSNLDELIEQIFSAEENVIVSSNRGSFVMMSEEKYTGLLEALYLSSNPQYKESLLEGLRTSIDQTISEADVIW
jgi:antitoxin YefM